MLNQSVIVGRLVTDTKEINKEDKKIKIIIAVPRSYKNEKTGEYDTYFIPCELWNGVAQNTIEYVKKGDLLGIKGRLQKLEDEEMILVAEKVTFLSTKEKE